MQETLLTKKHRRECAELQNQLNVRKRNDPGTRVVWSSCLSLSHRQPFVAIFFFFFFFWGGGWGGGGGGSLHIFNICDTYLLVQNEYGRHCFAASTAFQPVYSVTSHLNQQNIIGREGTTDFMIYFETLLSVGGLRMLLRTHV